MTRTEGESRQANSPLALTQGNKSRQSIKDDCDWKGVAICQLTLFSVQLHFVSRCGRIVIFSIFRRLLDMDTNNLKPHSIQVSRVEMPGRGVITKVNSDSMGAATYLFLASDGNESTVQIDVATVESLQKCEPKFHYRMTPEPKYLVVGNDGDDYCFEHDFDSGSEMVFKGRPVKAIMLEGGIDLANRQSNSTPPVMNIDLKGPEVRLKLEVGFIRLECKRPNLEHKPLKPIRRSFMPMPRLRRS